jgi:hypothetical protein
VNPLTPMVMPVLISCAACSAVMILFSNDAVTRSMMHSEKRMIAIQTSILLYMFFRCVGITKPRLYAAGAVCWYYRNRYSAV